MCNNYYAAYPLFVYVVCINDMIIISIYTEHARLLSMRIFLTGVDICGVIIITMKKQTRTGDPKIKALREQGTLNSHPERVTDSLFLESEFFDTRDVVQVKYEMLRRVEADGKSVTAAAAAFGLSRPAFYQAQLILRKDGLPGLIPKKRGPRTGHKLREEALDYIEAVRAANRSLTVSELISQITERFGIRVHRRTLERALRRREKKRL
jgi:transposase